MKVKGLRWMVIGLIMLITIINYLDRGTLNYMWVANIDYHLVSEADASADKGNHAVLAGEQYIRNDPDASQKAKDILGLITIFFMIAYGISQLVSGKLYDKIGCRKGFFWSVLVWGAADALASLSRGIFSLTFFRMMLGLGEAGPWPGTTKSNAEWFPQKERAFAQGLFGAAASIGSILAPIIILMLFIAFGWKLTFIVVGGLGLIWLIPWLIINKEGPKKHPWITEEERTYILSGQPEQELKTEDKGKSWGELLRVKKNWSVILGRFFLDPIWWMTNLQTIPSYLHSGKSVGSLAGLGGASAVLGTILAILFASYITNWILLFSLLGALVPLSLCSIFLTVGEIKQIKK